MALLRTTVQVLNRAMGVLAAIALVGLTGLITLQVILRRMFDSPLIFVDEVSGYLLVIVTFLGLGYAMQCGDHIRVEMGQGRLSASALRWLSVAWYVIGLVFTLVLTVESAKYAIDSVRLGSVSITSQIPLAPFQALIPVGTGLLALELLIGLIDTLISRPS